MVIDQEFGIRLYLQVVARRIRIVHRRINLGRRQGKRQVLPVVQCFQSGEKRCSYYQAGGVQFDSGYRTSFDNHAGYSKTEAHSACKHFIGILLRLGHVPDPEIVTGQLIHIVPCNGNSLGPGRVHLQGAQSLKRVSRVRHIDSVVSHRRQNYIGLNSTELDG